MANFTQKLEKLKLRRQDAETKLFSLNDNFNKKAYGESTTYALESMSEINKSYTDNTYKAVERVQNQLTKNLEQTFGIYVDYEYQGSVPTNTHIKLYSDFDLLTIIRKFYSLEPPLVPQYPYLGDPLQDLKNLRSSSYRILDTVFDSCTVDNTGSKALTISGGSLNRKIDVIASNWYDTVNYNSSRNKILRGIQILDLSKNDRIINFPFYHIHQINEKDMQVGGNEKRMIRLLKSLKADSDYHIKISSYDIASLVFRMDNNLLITPHNQRLNILKNTILYLDTVIANTSFREGLLVANGTRKIFCIEGAKLEDVVLLNTELKLLTSEIAMEFTKQLTSIEKSTIYY
jgi:hypothetical protein